MQDLKELYQEVILDHNRHPRNFGCMDGATCEAKGYNPLCGDKLNVYLKLIDNTILDLSFEGNGCAISQASASIMTEVIKGLNVADARALFHQVHELLTNDAFDAKTISSPKLQVLAGVKAYPARVKCASLAWHTLVAALNQDSTDAKTE
jgi:nitrogen fixation NifU-like protein